MTALDTDDLAVITGPLTVNGDPDVYLEPGEVVQVLGREDDGTILVWGVLSELEQWIDVASLTPLSDIHEDTEIDWGAADEQYVRLSGTHDYVYVEDEE
jgi:hypothetical protein